MDENLLSILNAEYIDRHKPQSINETNEVIDRYIVVYNNDQIQLKLEWR